MNPNEAKRGLGERWSTSNTVGAGAAAEERFNSCTAARDPDGGPECRAEQVSASRRALGSFYSRPLVAMA